MGKNNPQYEYYIGTGDEKTRLETTTSEKDLGISVDPELKFDSHINDKVKKVNSIAGLINRTISCKHKEIMVPLYKALIRPIIEYGNSVWCPNLRKDIDAIEAVQRRFTKRIIGSNDLDYKDRLIQLKLPTLESSN